MNARREEDDNLRRLREAALLAAPPKPGVELIGFYAYLAWAPSDGSPDAESNSYCWLGAPTSGPGDALWRGLYEVVIEDCENAIREVDAG